MKKIITLLLVLGAFAAKAQSSFEYNYDAAGNRIKRKVIVLDETREGGSETVVDKDDRYTFNLFPNPTEGMLTIEAEEIFMEIENKKAVVYDLNGNVVHEISISTSTIPVDLSNNIAGTYVVKIQATGYSKEWKIVKL